VTPSLTQAELSKIKKHSLFIENILNIIPDPIFVKDANHTLIYSNHAFAKILGMPQADFLGKSDYELFPKEMVDVSWEWDTKVLENNITTENEELIQLAGGEKRTILTKKSMSYDEDGKKVIVGVIRDITDLRRQEEEIEVSHKKIGEQELKMIQASKMSALGEMASGIAHEINNPLTIIQGRARQIGQMLKNVEMDKKAEVNNYLEQIQNTVDRIAKIVQGLKSFARESDHLPKEQVNLSKLIHETLDLCVTRFETFGISLRLNLDNEVFLSCRSVQISQVLLNLLNNSFDAIVEEKAAWISLRFNSDEENVFLYVTDSGPGIPRPIAEKIFQPFFTTKEIGKGTGLGMSISKGIIDAHEGEIYYDKTSANTQFVIRLPKNLRQ